MQIYMTRKDIYMTHIDIYLYDVQSSSDIIIINTQHFLTGRISGVCGEGGGLGGA